MEDNYEISFPVVYKDLDNNDVIAFPAILWDSVLQDPHKCDSNSIPSFVLRELNLTCYRISSYVK